MSDRKIAAPHHGTFPRTLAILQGRLECLELGLKDPALQPWQKVHLEELAWEAVMLRSMLKHPDQRTSIEVPADF